MLSELLVATTLAFPADDGTEVPVPAVAMSTTTFRFIAADQMRMHLWEQTGYVPLPVSDDELLRMAWPRLDSGPTSDTTTIHEGTGWGMTDIWEIEIPDFPEPDLCDDPTYPDAYKEPTHSATSSSKAGPCCQITDDTERCECEAGVDKMLGENQCHYDWKECFGPSVFIGAVGVTVSTGGLGIWVSLSAVAYSAWHCGAQNADCLDAAGKEHDEDLAACAAAQGG